MVLTIPFSLGGVYQQACSGTSRIPDKGYNKGFMTYADLSEVHVLVDWLTLKTVGQLSVCHL